MIIRKYQFSMSRALLFFAVAACGKAAAVKTPPVPVELAPATVISAPLTIEANGVVEPLQTVSVLSQVGGTLDTVAFHEGDDVQAGQELFRLDPRPFEAAERQAEATLARDEAQALSAQRDADRYKALVEKDYVTKSQSDQATATADAAKATVQADHASVDNAKLNVAYTIIRSPITGRTGRLLVRQGNVVRPNADALIVINQLRPILVRFPVLQHDFPALQRRAARGDVPVRAIAADSGVVGEIGTLAFLDNAVDSLTGTVTAKARFLNQANALWPGEYVRVSVELAVESNVVAVPTRAIVAGQDGNYVFVVGNDKVAKVRSVSTGRVTGDLTTIAQGLKPGEQVVVDGQSRLTPNARVDIKASNKQAVGTATGA
ncbi:MAG TPA: efflux RND transporter periplasmic adaptor subunit, partial [Gemmatimonadaceae bacterium]|nr:efflux RND transporter periplasmic adaptor subunit [Gemmatimonadaceae bacterium]